MTYPTAAPLTFPGKMLGIVGLIAAFVAPPIGVVLSIVSKVQSKGFKNTPATAGIVVGAILIVLYIAFFVILFTTLFSQCGEYGPGVHQLPNGGTLTCS
jgi:hypothetical protein